MAKRPINQKDIAKSLKLSIATVSKALSDYDDVNMETKAKVVNMASKMGYHHSSVFRETVVDPETKSCMVGVFILRRIHEWQHTSYFAGMSEKCAKLNVSLVLHYINQEDPAQILRGESQPPAMRQNQLAGLILVNKWPDDIAANLASKWPCVSIEHEIEGTKTDVIGVDNEYGISLLMDHLYSLGHRKIGFFGKCNPVAWSRSRLGGYFSSLCRLGLEVNPDYVVDLDAEYLEDKSFELRGQVEKVMTQYRRGVQAWICVNDWTGYVLCRGLLDRGVRVPQEISIAGFDDSEENTLGCPKLTSTTVPTLKIGAEALRRLLVRIRHPQGPDLHVTLKCRLFEGLTTAKLHERL